MSPLVYALGTGGLGAILAAVIAGVFSKRKLTAEATQIITNAAAGVVTNLTEEVKRQEQSRMAAETRHLSEMSAQKRQYDRDMNRVFLAFEEYAEKHAIWDQSAVDQLAAVDIHLSAPPPAPKLRSKYAHD